MFKQLCKVVLTMLVIGLCIQARAEEPIQWTDGKTSVTFYGTLDAGYVRRWGDNGAVPNEHSQDDFQSAAGSDGSRLGIKVSYDLGHGNKIIGAAEYGFNVGGQKEDGSGGKTFFDRQSWLGLTGGWGTLLGGTVDGGRASVLKKYDPFQGRSVASAGSLQLVTSRAKEAFVYITPKWHGLSATVAYTPNLLGVSDHDSRSPVYAAILAYDKGPWSISYDHEEEWWNNVAGLTRLKVNLVGTSYDFNALKLYGYYDHTSVEKPFDTGVLGFYQAHKGYLLGFTMPVGTKGLVKASWNRRDSAYIDNRCTKWGVGYQHNLSDRVYLYTDYAKISNGSKGTCTIAYSNEQTSADLGKGDAGGYGTDGVDFGLVLSF